jgi:predicted peroxiredoxin
MGLLGILVATRDSLDHLLGLVNAAAKQGVEVVVFLTGEGVLVTQDPRFGKLSGRVRMALCEVSFRGLSLKGEVPGLGFKDFATQARHAEMLEECPHYVML